MFKERSQGLYSYTSSPSYGNQDVGVSPAGAMDRFSYLTGNIILGNPEDAPALEIIFPPGLEAEEDGFIILTGAPYKNSFIIRDEEKITFNHGEVFAIKKADRLELGQRVEGFRTYLSYRKSIDVIKSESPEGRKRETYKKYATWPSVDGSIRIIKGPEYTYLENPETLVDTHWVVSKDTGNMGMRLESPVELKLNMGNMISEAVADGTIQITNKGPIILLRHRQTVGGYARCFNVIQTDVDRLAQYMPGEIIRFSLVEIDDAIKASKLMKNDLDRLRNRYKTRSK